MNRADVLVVGGGAGGMSVAAAAKRARRDWRVVVVEAGPYISFAACGIPYLISGETKSLDELLVLTPKSALEKKAVEALVFHRVEEVDRNGRRALVRDIQNDRTFEIEYGKLVIATGAKPVVPNLPGVDAEGVFTLRSLPDAEKMLKYIEANSPRRAVVVGAGYVGIEMAEALSARGMSVTVIEMLPTVMRLCENALRDAIVSEGERHGVEFVLGQSVAAVETSGGRARAVHTESGDVYEADLVLIAVGVHPNVTLAERIGLELGAANAVYVDLQGQTSAPNIYAVGDCAQVRDIVTGRWIWVPLGTVANRQGRATGYALAGKVTQFKGIVRASVAKFFDLAVCVVGVPKDEAKRLGWRLVETTVKASSCSHYYPASKPVFVHLYADAETGRILGGQFVGPWQSIKRFDLIAAAVANRMTADDLAYLDIPYSPPVGTVWDPINVAARRLAG